MAHFIGTIQGNRGEASRLGSKQSGIRVTANSYTIGGEIFIYHDESLGKDIMAIGLTRGSNSRLTPMISMVIEDDEFKVIETNYPEILI